MDLNKVMLIGRLTRDPESRTTPQGVTVCNFSLATSRTWKDDQGVTQDRTEFHNIVAWRRLGEICAQYLVKGRQIYLEGHLETRNWEDQNGQKRYRTEVIADNMIMLGSKGEGAKPAGATEKETEREPSRQAQGEPAMVAAPAQGVADEEIRIEDIPF